MDWLSSLLPLTSLPLPLDSLFFTFRRKLEGEESLGEERAGFWGSLCTDWLLLVTEPSSFWWLAGEDMATGRDKLSWTDLLRGGGDSGLTDWLSSSPWKTDKTSYCLKFMFWIVFTAVNCSCISWSLCDLWASCWRAERLFEFTAGRRLPLGPLGQLGLCTMGAGVQTLRLRNHLTPVRSWRTVHA